MDTSPEDIRRLVGRLAVAVIAADGRITTTEVAALARLDDLGLGPLGAIAREEIARAIDEPIEVRATCAALRPLSPEAAGFLVSVLAEIAASDRLLAPRERDVLGTIAGDLGLVPAATARILEMALGERPAAFRSEPAPARMADTEHAFRVLGLAPGASRSSIELSFLDLVQRYNPARAAELGPEFAALAVRRLATVTAAYEAACASLESPS
jgi:DnaJ-domain-containing protein 1